MRDVLMADGKLSVIFNTVEENLNVEMRLAIQMVSDVPNCLTYWHP